MPRPAKSAPLLTLLAALAACEAKAEDPPKNTAVEPSPNASILPAPLTTEAVEPRAPLSDAGGILADPEGRLVIPEAGAPPPRSLREDETLPRDTLTARDGVGITLDAQFRWYDVPAAPPLPEANTDAIQKLKAPLVPSVTVDLGAVGRMRFALTSATFPLPQGAELRSRTDAYGHVLVWPDGSKYRVLVPGALRAMFTERRADVSPLIEARIGERGKGSLLGFATERVQLSTPAGKLVLEQARPGGLGSSGRSLCRLLVELVSAEPASSACEDELLPLRAEYQWTDGGKITFEVTAMTRRPELPFGLLFVPPAAAEPKIGELPPPTSGVLLTRDELAQIRHKPVTGANAKDAPGEGILAVNRTDTLRFVLLDGLPIAWVAPRSERYVIGPPQGRYSIAWRDFFGTRLEPPKTIQLPARIVIGRADGG